jgi:teichuronic acid biosynthesis glycosyltransferase TuaC
MKILFISSGNTKGGISPVVKKQGETLINKGIDITYFTIRGKGLKGYLKAIFQIKKYLKGKTFDLIHVHYGLSGLSLALARPGFPSVISFMGDDIMGSNKLDGSFTIQSRILTKINKWLAANYFNQVIVKSGQMLDRLNLPHVSVIPNGVDVNQFYPEEKAEARKQLNLPNDKRIVIFVSNPQRAEKNIVLSNKAVDLLNDPIVELIPVFNKSHDEVRHWMNAADVLVLTSFHEGSPNVIKEAMACKLPIVSTDVGDVRQVIDSVEGCFLAGYEPDEFAQKLKQALDFSTITGRTKGRERIMELALDSDSIAERIIDIYKRVLN